MILRYCRACCAACACASSVVCPTPWQTATGIVDNCTKHWRCPAERKSRGRLHCQNSVLCPYQPICGIGSSKVSVFAKTFSALTESVSEDVFTVLRFQSERWVEVLLSFKCSPLWLTSWISTYVTSNLCSSAISWSIWQKLVVGAFSAFPWSCTKCLPVKEKGEF